VSEPFSLRKTGAVLRRIRDAVFDLIYPKRCLFCGGRLDEFPDDPIPPPETGVCPECRGEFLLAEGEYCPFCAGSIHWTESDREHCGACRRERYLFDKVIALGAYQDRFRQIILMMKQETSGETARGLARMLFYARRKELTAHRFDRVIPVPRHFLRKWRYGVNDADFIAAELARLLKVPYDSKILKRVRGTRRQTEVRRSKRRANVSGAFAVQSKLDKPLFGERILLADDILTTGATADEITQVLKDAGAVSVTVAVCGRAEGGG